MAAGLGFKDFTTGEVLTAADVDGYLMQGIWVFASAAARDAAVTSPQEGNFAFLKDTNTTTYYTGSAWTNLDTTGMVNPMTTTGDTIYSSSGSTPARLGIGSTGQVLTVAGGVPSWATPAGGGGMTLLSTTTLSGATTDITSISQDYNTLEIHVYGVTNATANGVFFCTPRNSTTSLDVAGLGPTSVGGSSEIIWGNAVGARLSTDGSGLVMDRTNANNFWVVRMANYASTTTFKSYEVIGAYYNTDDGRQEGRINQGCVTSNSAVNALRFSNSGGNLSTGTVKIYGVK